MKRCPTMDGACLGIRPPLQQKRGHFVVAAHIRKRESGHSIPVGRFEISTGPNQHLACCQTPNSRRIVKRPQQEPMPDGIHVQPALEQQLDSLGQTTSGSHMQRRTLATVDLRDVGHQIKHPSSDLEVGRSRRREHKLQMKRRLTSLTQIDQEASDREMSSRDRRPDRHVQRGNARPQEVIVTDECLNYRKVTRLNCRVEIGTQTEGDPNRSDITTTTGIQRPRLKTAAA
jgi:hypothetical protein